MVILLSGFLIRQSFSANETLITTHRKVALGKVEVLLDELDKELTKANAESDFRSSVLKPLVALKSSIETQDSIAHLQQAEQRGDATFQKQIAVISEYVDKKAKEKPDLPPVEKIKPVVTVKSSNLISKPYLETKDDVKDFVANMEKQLNEAIDNGQRVKVE